MNRRVFFRILIPALGVASTVAIATGERRAVSLQIWLGVFVVAIAVMALGRLREASPFSSAKPGAIYTNDTEPVLTASRNRRLRIIEGVVVRSRDNERTFSQQLQPQLIDLATHFLRVNHGVDIARDPLAGTAVLGELSWLVDESVSSRTPTLAELDRFVELLTTPSRAGAA